MAQTGITSSIKDSDTNPGDFQAQEKFEETPMLLQEQNVTGLQTPATGFICVLYWLHP